MPLPSAARRLAAAAVLVLSDARLLAQAPLAGPPTILERREEQRAKNPELDEKLASAAATMKEVAWMTGKWDVAEKTFATSRTPESTAKGTREASFELDGRSLLARQTAGTLKTLEILVYDPFRGNWFLQILTNGGRGALEPLVSTMGWESGSLRLEGRFSLYGLNTEIVVRITREGNDAYREVLEEKVAGGVYRPVFEFRYTRPGAPAAKKGSP